MPTLLSSSLQSTVAIDGIQAFGDTEQSVDVQIDYRHLPSDFGTVTIPAFARHSHMTNTIINQHAWEVIDGVGIPRRIVAYNHGFGFV